MNRSIFAPWRSLLGFYSVLVLCLPVSSHANGLSIQPPEEIGALTICMNFGCKTRQTIAISTAEWESVANWFRPPADDAAQERKNIRQAIGWMEVIVGRHTPTYRDMGGDLGHPNARFPGQLDCIDESINTTNYLRLFEKNNLLKYHKVVSRAYRRAIFDQHWAGQIEELDTGKRWVVDSWFQNNGYLPYLQASEAWEDINVFTANLDSSQKDEQKSGSFLRRLFE